MDTVLLQHLNSRRGGILPGGAVGAKFSTLSGKTLGVDLVDAGSLH
jgi:hypothetical protein